MNTEDLWRGRFGDAYTVRNNTLNADAGRAAVWHLVLPDNVRSVLEVGANVGKNLEAIDNCREVELYAAEPNELARQELENIVSPHNITADWAHKLSFPDNVADLGFTCGVLIHVSSDKLVPSMREIYRCSRKWIICAEYFAPSEEMVPYRGHDDALWRRDYGSLWLDNFPDLHCHFALFAWKRATGFDNLTFWLLEKRGRTWRN